MKNDQKKDRRYINCNLIFSRFLKNEAFNVYEKHFTFSIKCIKILHFLFVLHRIVIFPITCCY